MILDSHSFVLRIWWEDCASRAAWRGRIQHARSGQAEYICRLPDLLAFIETYTGSLSTADAMRADSLPEANDHDPHSTHLKGDKT